MPHAHTGVPMLAVAAKANGVGAPSDNTPFLVAAKLIPHGGGDSS